MAPPSSAPSSNGEYYKNDKMDRQPSVVESGLAQVTDGPVPQEGIVDGVFGEQAQDGKGPNYRSVGWVSTSILLIKAQIGLGVLNIPDVFHTLGLGPGIICLLVIGFITSWTDYYIGVFKLKHPEVYSVGDCGRLMYGRVGGELFFGMVWLLFTCIAGSALLGISTALNAISLHGTCTAVFVAIAAVVTVPIAALRTLGGIKWIGWIGVASMVVSILLVTIAVGAGGRPSLAPQEGPVNLDLVMWGNPTFAEAMNALGNLVFAFAGTSIFLPIASEMRDPREYPKAVALCQSFVTTFYLVVGVVVYMYAGQYVASPALGTAGVLIKRVAYGLALPGLFAAAIILSHLAAKMIFVRVLRNSRHLTQSTPTHWFSWLGCVIGCVLFAYIIASAIPVFSGLVGLVGALFGSFLSFNAEALMYLYDHWAKSKDSATRTWKLTSMIVFNILINVIGALLIVGGAYGSIITIRDSYAENGGRAFTCTDNSGSV
ncbi:hypothetical protein JCM10207_003192 [Rhodosporidiobolus poonsookiae]